MSSLLLPPFHFFKHKVKVRVNLFKKKQSDLLNEFYYNIDTTDISIDTLDTTQKLKKNHSFEDIIFYFIFAIKTDLEIFTSLNNTSFENLLIQSFKPKYAINCIKSEKPQALSPSLIKIGSG